MSSKLLIRGVVVLSVAFPVVVATSRLLGGKGIDARLLAYVALQALLAFGLTIRLSVVRWIAGALWCAQAALAAMLASYGSVAGGPSLGLTIGSGAAYLLCGIVVMTPLVRDHFARSSESQAVIG